MEMQSWLLRMVKSNHKMVMKTVILNIEIVMGFISHGYFFYYCFGYVIVMF